MNQPLPNKITGFLDIVQVRFDMAFGVTGAKDSKKCVFNGI